MDDFPLFGENNIYFFKSLHSKQRHLEMLQLFGIIYNATKSESGISKLEGFFKYSFKNWIRKGEKPPNELILR